MIGFELSYLSRNEITTDYIVRPIHKLTRTIKYRLVVEYGNDIKIPCFISGDQLNMLNTDRFLGVKFNDKN